MSLRFGPWREYDPRVLGTCICLFDHDINFTIGEKRQRSCEPLVPSGITPGETGRAVDFYPAFGLVTPHSTFVSSNCRSLTSGRNNSLCLWGNLESPASLLHTDGTGPLTHSPCPLFPAVLCNSCFGLHYKILSIKGRCICMSWINLLSQWFSACICYCLSAPWCALSEWLNPDVFLQ